MKGTPFMKAGWSKDKLDAGGYILTNNFAATLWSNQKDKEEGKGSWNLNSISPVLSVDWQGCFKNLFFDAK